MNEGYPENIRFYPYFLLKDYNSLLALLFILTYLVHFDPNLLGHPDNYIPANPLITPKHIVPEWYFLPFYAILRSFDSKNLGVVAMFCAIFILFVLPFFYNGRNSIPNLFRYLFKLSFWFFVLDFIFLGWLGGNAVEEPYNWLGMCCTQFYFSYFLVIVPALETLERFLFNRWVNRFYKSIKANVYRKSGFVNIKVKSRYRKYKKK